jgi:predicted amidophosphoribosyltransferase
VWSLAPHEGPARALVAALKFRAQLPIASLAAVRMAALAPPPILVGRSVVPVPAAPSRRRSRGFDPAARIACEFAKQADLPLSACLRREGGPRQVGRPRAERLADPPRVRAAGAVPPSAVLVDDVMTTGATLGACAAALRVAGADGVTAVTFARTP